MADTLRFLWENSLAGIIALLLVIGFWHMVVTTMKAVDRRGNSAVEFFGLVFAVYSKDRAYLFKELGDVKLAQKSGFRRRKAGKAPKTYYEESLSPKIRNCLETGVSANRLEFLALFESGKLIGRVDLFEYDEVKTRLRGKDTAIHRERCAKISEYAVRNSSQAENELACLGQGPLLRSVFDVERGALYVYEVDATLELMLVGIASDQHSVIAGDISMVLVAGRIREAYGLMRLQAWNPILDLLGVPHEASNL